MSEPGDNVGRGADVGISSSGAAAGSQLVHATRQRRRRRRVPSGESFTFRGVMVGLLVGLIVCFSNMYFGLQTGWVSPMTLPASLMGFGVFRILAPHLKFPFTPVENVLVQTVAGSMALMPLGCGFVGVIPAMNFLLSEDEQGPLTLGLGKLVIIRERLRFPSGFSTAILIGVLHGQPSSSSKPGSGSSDYDPASTGGFASLVPYEDDELDTNPDSCVAEPEQQDISEWASSMRLLVLCFGISGTFTVATYFFPALRSIPIFGTTAAINWLWTLNPSLAYVGQGIIMGPETSLHMLLGAVMGWAILSPLAKSQGWAPGPITDWETGSKGWIVWISLAIMLTDALINLGHISLKTLLASWKRHYAELVDYLVTRIQERIWGPLVIGSSDDESRPLLEEGQQGQHGGIHRTRKGHDEDDAPRDQQVGTRIVWGGLAGSIILCVSTTHFVFGCFMPLSATVLAVGAALILSVMGVRALGETDLNPVSGISKLAQLLFAIVIPSSHKAVVLINLVAGAIGALQAGELMQDLKTGHLLGAAPVAQFQGQIIGATAGAITSALIYRLYASVYPIPGDLLQVPTSYVWIFTARLVTGKGLPTMAREFATGSAILFSLTTVARLYYASKTWRPYIPGGIAVAIGMYNVPSFTIARTLGGLGFILGEGFLSIVNLILQSLRISHF
ncbi:putative oligopeptide transporter [Ceratocystis lukuohia]|uniref:Oligopeptide transporter n=1 Tax=Ceratocystis lukuohia TaxID=2019550 RepID=A0ABR4ML70_9PEZI